MTAGIPETPARDFGLVVWRVFCHHFERPGSTKQRKLRKMQDLSSVWVSGPGARGREGFGEGRITVQHVKIAKYGPEKDRWSTIFFRSGVGRGWALGGLAVGNFLNFYHCIMFDVLECWTKDGLVSHAFSK